MKKAKKVLTLGEKKTVDLLWEIDKYLRTMNSYTLSLKKEYRKNNSHPIPSNETLQLEMDEWKISLYSQVFELAHEIQGTKDKVIDVDLNNGKIIIAHTFKK